MKDLMIRITHWLCSLKALPPLFFRLALAYGFYQPALEKLNNHEATTQAFASLGIPLPGFSAYLVALVEALGVPLLVLGLMTRWISALLWVVMLVAIFGVHVPTHTDFMVPLWFALALFSLMVTGAGRLSLDAYFWCCEKAVCSASKSSCESPAPKTGGCCQTSQPHEHHDKSSGGCCRH
jgi:putative oxidoreductase